MNKYQDWRPITSSRYRSLHIVFSVLFISAIFFMVLLLDKVSDSIVDNQKKHWGEVQQEGYESYQLNIEPTANPYRKGDRSAVEWLEGWKEGAKNANN